MIRGFQSAVFFVAVLLCTPVLAVEDVRIGDAVEDRLAFDPAVPEGRIDVKTQGGVVTLQGVVPHLPAKERAALLAETVKGVRETVNELQVVPPGYYADPQIKQQVEAALAEAAVSGWEKVAVSVGDGQVALDGSVESWADRAIVLDTVGGVEGVRRIEDNLRVEPPQRPTDQEIAAGIIQALRWDARIDDALISVAVAAGEVRLAGVVGSAAEKRQAVRVAGVDGVVAIEASNLRVARWSRDEDLRDGKYAPKRASAIERAIEGRLRRDPRIDASRITLSAQGGTVVMRGAVDTLWAKWVASTHARYTVGVRRVKNRLKVRPAEAPSDEEIVDRLRAALNRDPYFEDNQITAQVSDGVAVLSGEVGSLFEKLRAEAAAGPIAGIREVNNRLNVHERGAAPVDLAFWGYVLPPDFQWRQENVALPSADDDEIREDIEEALYWSPYVDRGRVRVQVNDGVATLLGTVSTPMGRDAAVSGAYQAGAARVRNHLSVAAEGMVRGE